MSAYIARLNLDIERAAAAISVPAPDLRQRFIEWYAAIPEISRQRAFAMIELERAFSTQGKYLSPILLSLGWQRRRKWSDGGQYCRYWLPPSAKR